MNVRTPLPGLSLKRQLLLWLLLPQLVLWSVGGVLAWRLALRYADTGIDQSLKQSVRALARQVKPVGSGLLVDFPRAAQDVLEQDPTDRMGYMVSSPPGSFVLGNGKLPPPPDGILIQVGEPVIYDARVADKRVRVALLDVTYGEPDAPQRLRVQVAKSLAVQERVARELVFDMLVPLAALGVLLGLLINAGIARGLRPLKRLEAQLGDRSGPALSSWRPIELAQAPQEVHSLALAVNELLDAVRRSLSQEKRFVNDAAHQLRTPLAGLVSQSELALKETELQPLRERVAKVHAGALRSAHLVHQLLSLARTEAEVALHPLDIALLAREVACEWTPKALAAQVDLGYEGDSMVIVQGEKLLLREALNNLIDNALHYAGTHATLTVRVRTVANRCWLEVEDDGPGLPQADLPRAFERFWRSSELPGGCGLGLAIVAEIALRHGGSATALAAQPHGLVVKIELPLLVPGPKPA